MSSLSYRHRRKLQTGRKTTSKLVAIACVIVGAFVIYGALKKYRSNSSKSQPKLNSKIIAANTNPKTIDKAWLLKCPKIELHAHLHGSIRMSTLAELYSDSCTSKDAHPQQQIRQILKSHKTFNEIFALFDVIHRVVRSKRVLVRIINEVLMDFAKQSVIYLEIRSTPRILSDSGHSRSQYVDILVHEIETFHIRYPYYKAMQIRLLLTINNSKPLSEAEETIAIAEKHLKDCKRTGQQCIIVGIDFAPRNISGKQFKYFEKVLKYARAIGLRITIHFAEFFNAKEQQIILDFKPDRIGHAVFLTENDIQTLIEHPIPIEMCPTSNILCKSIVSYDDHPFKVLRERSIAKYGELFYYPMLFCTDDCGVFDTDLSNEWFQMCVAHQLSKGDVKQILLNSVQFIFADDENVKISLVQTMNDIQI